MGLKSSAEPRELLEWPSFPTNDRIHLPSLRLSDQSLHAKGPSIHLCIWDFLLTLFLILDRSGLQQQNSHIIMKQCSHSFMQWVTHLFSFSILGQCSCKFLKAFHKQILSPYCTCRYKETHKNCKPPRVCESCRFHRPVQYNEYCLTLCVLFSSVS